MGKTSFYKFRVPAWSIFPNHFKARFMCQVIFYTLFFFFFLSEPQIKKKISAQSVLWIKMTRKAPIKLATFFPGTPKLAMKVQVPNACSSRLPVPQQTFSGIAFFYNWWTWIGKWYAAKAKGECSGTSSVAIVSTAQRGKQKSQTSPATSTGNALGSEVCILCASNQADEAPQNWFFFL